MNKGVIVMIIGVAVLGYGVSNFLLQPMLARMVESMGTSSPINTLLASLWPLYLVLTIAGAVLLIVGLIVKATTSNK
ncbi:MAG: hypothetical protein ACFFCS_15125 [Candidatus Hodarchaeota archaeon]